MPPGLKAHWRARGKLPMERFAFELVLGALLLAFVLWTWRKQEPRRPLQAAEIERYLEVIATQFPVPDGADRPAILARLRHFAEHDDGRDIYMTNLLRYHEKMASGPAPAGSFTGSRDAANAIYEKNTSPILLTSGAFPIFAGTVAGPNVVGGSDPTDDNWSRVLVVHYPSRRHFFDLLTNPRYLAKADFKTYAMYVGLVPCQRQLVIPDFRFLAPAGALIVFVAAAGRHALLG